MAQRSDTDLLQEIRSFLQYHESLGITEYPRRQALQSFLAKQKKSTPPPVSGCTRKVEQGKTAATGKHQFDPGLTGKVTLQDVENEIGDCHRCSLHKTRSSIVFGQGPVDAKLMIVTDAPAFDDDRLQAPVQGAPGKLLDKMLAAIGLAREDVYITSLVKCYPGKNKAPAPDEITTCLPFLFRQIEIVCPRVACTMGALASQTLLRSSRSLFQLRGRFANFNDLCSSRLDEKIVLMPSLPPSLLLENTELKKASWHDLQLIRKKLPAQ
jgi:DNA polymerase